MVIQTAFIGDAILATSFIRNLEEQYSGSDLSIDVLVRKGNQVFFEDLDVVAQVYTWEKKKNKYRNLLKLTSSLSKNSYDVVYNLHRYSSSGLLTSQIKAKQKIGFKSNPLSFLYDKRIDHEIPYERKGAYSLSPGYLHEVERNSLLLSEESQLRRPFFEIPDLSPDFSEKLGAFNIVLAPGSVWETKHWPIDYWVELINEFPESVRFFVIGSQEDFQIGERLSQVRDHVFNCCGKIDLLQSTALIKSSDLIYTNDSAPMHLASVANTVTRAIYCATKIELGFGPLADYSLYRKSRTGCCSTGLHGAKKCKAGDFHCGRDLTAKIVAGRDPDIFRAARKLKAGEAVVIGVESSNSLQAVRPFVEKLESDQAGTVQTLYAETPDQISEMLALSDSSLGRVLEIAQEFALRILVTGDHFRDASGISSSEVAIEIPQDPEWLLLLKLSGGVLAARETDKKGDPILKLTPSTSEPANVIRYRDGSFELLEKGFRSDELAQVLSGFSVSD